MRVLADFAGHWSFLRDIAHGDGNRANVRGTARFEPASKGLQYHETGQMMFNGAVMETSRTYLWGDGLEIFFEDGRPFHKVPPAGGQAQHWCAPDQYDVAYDFASWPDWSSRWTVSGPRKDYVMTTRYTRVLA